MVCGINPFVFLYSLGEQRPNVFSFGDLAILCGMEMVCHHRKINHGMFEKHHRRLSPYCSVASLYFWAVAGGVIPEMKDYTPKRSGEKSENFAFGRYHPFIERQKTFRLTHFSRLRIYHLKSLQS